MPQDYHWSTAPDGMSLEDIAKATGLTYNQVRLCLYRALIKLRLKAIANNYMREDYIDCYGNNDLGGV